jgi:hypothetical protein
MVAAKTTAERAAAGRGRRLPRTATAMAAAGCAVALVAGCGTGGGRSAAAAAGAAGGEAKGVETAGDGGAGPGAGGGPSAAVRGAAQALVRAGSARVGTSMRMASGGTWVTVTGTGRFDFAAGRGQLTLVLPQDAAGTEEHKPVTELLTPGALYMKDRGEGVPEGKWVRVDTTVLPDGNLVTGGATDPLAAAQLLGGAQDVELVGAETLDGTEVRHVRGTADIARAARTAGEGTAGPLAAAAKGFAVTRVPFEAWLDPQGRLRRLVEHFTYGPAATGVGVLATTSYTDFGSAVAFALPAAADIWTGKIVSAP